MSQDISPQEIDESFHKWCGAFVSENKNKLCFSQSNLEGREEEVDEELGETQGNGGLGGFVCHKDEDHLMDTQQRDQGQSRLSQPEREKEHGINERETKTSTEQTEKCLNV